ncbi:MAG TPA: 50S ribosomal protein L24 [Candidatus Bathyarchaeia archaeon]|nr:50S ribosomal protein L24 [Candidatus Bathyarchaeia archaeon]
MKLKLKKGDQITVILGKDRGKRGKIEKLFPRKGAVLVPGINIIKKHVKPRGEGKPGGIVEMAKPLPISKVALICPKCSQSTRVGFRQSSGSVKERICRKCKQTV